MIFERTARILAAASYCLFLLTSFRAGWTRAETDFPNYYTAAVLVRKAEPLPKFYDWTWFQRQMNYAGVEAQLGSYVPQTPVTMLPIVPLAQWPVQTAKRAWLLLNLAFLAGTFWLLSKVTRFSFAEVALAAFLGHGALASNFLLGQYYVFLLFLLALAFFCLHRKREIGGGALVGLAFVLKLYAGPFFLFFAAKREWKSLTGAVVLALGMIGLAVVLFGRGDVTYFATGILPRALAGDLVDPYHPAYQTLSTLLRRTFVLEPELNPRPTWNAPGLFFLLSPLTRLTLLAAPLISPHANNFKRDFAWFFIAVVLASTSTASYTFVLLLLPVALLLDDEGPLGRVAVLACYALAAMPLRPGWMPFFPKLWALLALYFIAGRGSFRPIPWKRVSVAGLAALIMSASLAHHAMASYEQEPGRTWERILTEPKAIFSSSPAVLSSGIVYQSIGKAHYELRYLHDGRVEHYAFDGEALLPTALGPSGPVRFELVSHRRSTAMLLDPLSGRVRALSGLPPLQPPEQAISPDGRWVAFTCSSQICLRQGANGKTIRLTGGNCNSYMPAWEPDSSGIVFASDCGRGLGLPALYRARIANISY